MKLVMASVVGVLAGIVAAGSAQVHDALDATRDVSFRRFLTQFENATTRFVNGDHALWKQHASRRDDVTIMGGWGAYERGWQQVGERYDWAASRFRDSAATVKVEYVSSGVSGDLAYTVAIERSVVRLVDQAAPAPMALRVTHLFRREAGHWMLVHRHADPLIDKTAAATVLQKK